MINNRHGNAYFFVIYLFSYKYKIVKRFFYCYNCNDLGFVYLKGKGI